MARRSRDTLAMPLIGCVQHDCAECRARRRLRSATQKLVTLARRRGDSDPAYWKAVEAVETALAKGAT